jgi:hypothetical protein
MGIQGKNQELHPWMQLKDKKKENCPIRTSGGRDCWWVVRISMEGADARDRARDGSLILASGSATAGHLARTQRQVEGPARCSTAGE